MGEEDVMLYNGTNITKECMTIDLYLSDFVWTPAYKIQKKEQFHTCCVRRFVNKTSLLVKFLRIKEALTVHAFGALGLIQYWMRRVNFSCRAISLNFFSPQNMHASVISITPKYIEILFNFNQYYRSTWKAFAFCFIIPERYINFPFLWRMGVTTPADLHWNGRY